MLYRDKVNVQIRNPLATVLWHDIERMYAMRPNLLGRVGDSMVKLYEDGIYLRGGSEVVPAAEAAERGIKQTPEDAKRGTIAYSILQAHNTSGDPEALKIRFDAMASHDITFVGIIQTARASGMEQFPLPYVLTNCHNSLCAVGGTINEDDHVFGLSAAKKYGGIFVPPHIAVIHSFMRENFAGCGKMILGSDSHTRYGALGTMAVARAAASWQSNCCATPTMLPIPALSPSTSRAPRAPASARTMWRSPSSAPSLPRATLRTRSWSSWARASRA